MQVSFSSALSPADTGSSSSSVSALHHNPHEEGVLLSVLVSSLSVFLSETPR